MPRRIVVEIDPNWYEAAGNTQPCMVVGAATHTYTTIVNDFVCARCGVRLRQTSGGGLECGHGHPINSQHDLIPRPPSVVAPVVRARHEADHFLSGFAHWHSKEDAMRLQDRTLKMPGLERAGKVRMGYRTQLRKNGKPMTYQSGPKKGQPVTSTVNVSYFVLKDAPQVAAAYAGHPSVARDDYGEGPTELLVYLPFDDVNRVLTARYEWRRGKALHCAGDGEYIHYALSKDGLTTVIRDGFAVADYADDEWQVHQGEAVPCSGGAAQHGRRLWGRCADCTAAAGRPALTLRVLVRDPHSPHALVGNELAFYEIHSQSIVTYDILASQLDELARKSGGRLAGIPLVLTRVPVAMTYVQRDHAGNPTQRASVEHPLMTFRPDPRWVEHATQRAFLLAMGEGANAPALPPGGDAPFQATYDDDDEGEAFVQEGEVVEVEGASFDEGSAGAVEPPTMFEGNAIRVDLQTGEVVEAASSPEEAPPEEGEGDGGEPPQPSGYDDMDDKDLAVLMNNTPRPWPGPLAAASIRAKARKYGTNVKPEFGARGKLIATLGEAFESAAQPAVAMQVWLDVVFKAPETKKLSECQIRAALDYLKSAPAQEVIGIAGLKE